MKALAIVGSNYKLIMGTHDSQIESLMHTYEIELNLNDESFLNDPNVEKRCGFVEQIYVVMKPEEEGTHMLPKTFNFEAPYLNDCFYEEDVEENIKKCSLYLSIVDKEIAPSV